MTGRSPTPAVGGREGLLGAWEGVGDEHKAMYAYSIVPAWA
jgi:hypothetical protein